MKFYKFIIIIAVLIYFFVGCFVYIHVTALSDDDLEWIESYSYGDSVFYISKSDNIDTLIITKKLINNERKRFYFSEDLGPDYEANAFCKYKLKHSDKSIDGWISIKKRGRFVNCTHKFMVVLYRHY